MISQLGKYRIDGLLGKGAMGVVYKAFDPGIGRVVALKTIRKELLSDAEQAELIGRFKNEAQAAGRLNHPNIVTVFDYGEDAQAAYIAMEFVEGAGLDTLLAPGCATPTRRVLAWMRELLTALDYAHSRGVIHRDIKPANLLIAQTAQLKISDFGIARIDSSTLTQAGAVVGTPSYMAPEQFRGDAVDGRTDVFSAGIVLYQLLTGTRPFTGTASIVMQQIMNADPVPPSARLPALGTHFDGLLARAMAKRADARFPSALAFLDALNAAAQHGSDPDATRLVDHDLTMLAPAVAAARQDSAGTSSTISGLTTGTSSNTSSSTTMTPWKRAAFPDLEASLARQIGPLARYLLRKIGDQAEGLDHLSELLLPHIPSSLGRTQFQQALVQLKKKLDADGTGSGAVATATPARVDGAAPLIDDAYADATTRRLVALIGPIGQVVVKRALRQTGERAAFVQLLAAHIDNQDERARFLAEAGA